MVAVDRKGLDDLQKRLQMMAGLELRIGIMGPGGADTGPHPTAKGLSIAELAAIHEHGTPTLPARPIVRGYLANGGERELTADLEEVTRKVMDGADPKAELERVGAKHAEAMRARFDRGIGPAIDPKHDEGSHVPLHDTGAIAGAIRYHVGAR